MNYLDIEKATIGYDTIGLNSFLNELNTQVVDEVISTIHKNIPTVRSTVDEVWAGQAAEVFKERLEYDSETVVETLAIMKDLIISNISQIGVNVDEYDSAIAASIRGEEYSYSGTGMKSMVVDTGRDFGEYYNNKQEITQNIANGLESVNNIIERTGATVATAGFGIVEGIGKFGEAIVDTASIIGTIASTPVTWLLDAGQYISSKVTGNEYHSATEAMWDNTMNFVSNDYVGGAFNALYDKTSLGNYLKDNAFGFDLTRGISSGLGYTAGVVASTFVTCGLSGVTMTPTCLASTAATAGFGKGAQTAWAGGASLEKGLLYATGSGAWEGVQYFLGGKISELNVFANEGANIAARIGLDALDGAAEGFVQPALDSIYKEGTYGELFNEAGGWKNVGQQAAIGAIASAIGETKNIAGILKGDTVVETTGAVSTAAVQGANVLSEEVMDSTIGETHDNVDVINGDAVAETTGTVSDAVVQDSNVGQTIVEHSNVENRYSQLASTAQQVSYTSSGQFAYDGVEAMSVLDIVESSNPNAAKYRVFDDFVNDTYDDRIAWEHQLQETPYKDPITGREETCENLVKGYISENENRAGSYKLLNTVNRAAGNNPTETLNNLLLRDDNGALVLDSLGNPQIELKGVYETTVHYSIDMSNAGDILDARVYNTSYTDQGLNVDGSIGTVQDMFTRVNSETKALNDALSSYKTNNTIILGRGAGIDSLTRKYGITLDDNAETILAKLTRDGNLYSDKGFMSSTPELGGGFMRGSKVNFIMTVKEGTSLGNFGGYNFGEKEVLLPTGSQFNIDGVSRDVNGKIYIFLTQI